MPDRAADLRGMFDADRTTLPVDMIEEGDRVAVRWQFSASKDGRPVVMPGIAIYGFVHG